MLRRMPLQADLLKLIRSELGRRRWTASDLARQVGWSQSGMSRTLSESSILRVDDLGKLLVGLGVSTGTIVEAVAVALGDETGGGVKLQADQAGTVQRDRARSIELAMELLAELARKED